MLALLPVVAALGALGFVAAVVAAHLLRDDLPALDATLSAYFSGSTRQPSTYHGVLQKTLVAAIVLWIWLVSFTEGMASP